MPKRKEPELDPKEQFKRFQETAKELEVQPVQAEAAFNKLTKPSNSPSPSKQERRSG